MDDYISRESILSKCQQIWSNADETTEIGVAIINIVDELADFVENIPSADVQPVKHGRWIYDGDCMIASCCNTAYDINKFQNNNGTILVPTICPNCGRKMDGDESPKGE